MTDNVPAKENKPVEKTYAFIRQTLACILLFASTVAAAEIRPEVKVYEEPGWCVWCPSPVALPDGRFALVHSRWRESDGFEAWCAKSEIALAISQNGAVISKER